jgi:hypothetical protein
LGVFPQGVLFQWHLPHDLLAVGHHEGNFPDLEFVRSVLKRYIWHFFFLVFFFGVIQLSPLYNVSVPTVG